MKDVRMDADGELRCWNCGSKGFKSKRTLRSKVLVGVGALITKKKLKCETCGEYNDTGNAKPYNGPESRKYRKRYEAEEANRAAPSQSSIDELAKLVDMHEAGTLSDAEFEAAKKKALGL